MAVAGGKRQPIGIPGIAHRDPLPMGVKIGNFIFSSVLGPDVPGSDARPEGGAQIPQTFANLRALAEAGGAKLDDVSLVWTYLGDFQHMPAMVETWLDVFPTEGDRPSRKTFPYDLGGRSTLVQAQFIAALAGKRTNYEVEGIGHHDPIPLGARKGDYFFSSGITGVSTETGKLANGAEAQMDVALDNLRKLIEVVGGSLDNISLVTTLLADQAYAASALAAWNKRFPNPENRPALHVAKLGLPGRETLVQVHAIGGF
jgi:2-iminobutanoate/2-iminopropanoate deaminase